MRINKEEHLREITIKLASNYLRIGDNIPGDMLKELELAYDEIKENSNFKVIHRIFPIRIREKANTSNADYTKENSDQKVLGKNYYEIVGTSMKIEDTCTDFSLYTKDCDEVMLICATLSVELERFLRRQQLVSMSHTVVLDAVASAYLENVRDNYVEDLNLASHSFCFAPGYGDVPLALNKDIVRILEADKKIGVTVSDSNLFIPQKSIAGFIGIGNNLQKKSCRNCVRFEGCSLRQQNMTCYRK